MSSSHIELRRARKHFAGVRALDDVSLAVERGTVHALVGENGAGKSTLARVIAGALALDEGELLVDGNAVTLRSPRSALRHGIALISQELSIVPELTVAENVLLGSEPRHVGVVRRRALGRRYQKLADSHGVALDGGALTGGLRVSEMQQVEILRALARDAQLIIMDEPTAALSAPETRRLHTTIRELAGRGVTVILVSHFLDEVLALADTITVLRDGRLVHTKAVGQHTRESLIEAMLGRTLDASFPPRHLAPSDAAVVLRVDRLTAPGVEEASLSVRAGEIVGIAGLVGSGRTELARAVFGADRRRGHVELRGRTLAGGPRSSLRAGIAMLPESRKDAGLFLNASVTANASLANLRSYSRLGVLRRRREDDGARQALERCEVKGCTYRAAVSALSGGNQQKVLFARMLLCAPKLLIVDEPTRGVDVGAKRAIYDLLSAFARQGMGILLISSDVEEILGLAHRVLVMRHGRIVAELEEGTMSENAILNAAFADSDRTEQAA
jgi:ribose transport system ATP-binding protein